jgi:hypothetical protein
MHDLSEAHKVSSMNYQVELCETRLFSEMEVVHGYILLASQLIFVAMNMKDERDHAIAASSAHLALGSALKESLAAAQTGVGRLIATCSDVPFVIHAAQRFSKFMDQAAITTHNLDQRIYNALPQGLQ